MEIYSNKKEPIKNLKNEIMLSEQVITEEKSKDNKPAKGDLKKFSNKVSLTRSYSDSNKITFYSLEIIFEIMNTMAKEREIKWKYHYDGIIDKNARYVLRINIKSFFNKLIKKCRELGYQCCFDENKPYDLGRLIRHKEYCLGNFSVRLLREDESEKKDINSRCIYIDIAELENLGVNISGMLIDNTLVADELN